MSEYRKQILLSGTVAIIIGAGLALGVLYLPQTSQSSTTNSPITSTTNIGTTMGVSTSVLTVTSLNTSGTRALSDLSFNETGLPNGTYWQVSVFENNSGQVKPTTYNVQGVSSLLTLHIPNGTYGYSIPPTQGYSASPNYGSVTFITNASAVIPVQFYYTGTTTTSSCNPSDYSLNGTSSMINANSTFYIINISYNFASQSSSGLIFYNSTLGKFFEFSGNPEWSMTAGRWNVTNSTAGFTVQPLWNVSSTTINVNGTTPTNFKANSTQTVGFSIDTKGLARGYYALILSLYVVPADTIGCYPVVYTGYIPIDVT